MKYLLFAFFVFNKAVAQHVPKINFVPKDSSSIHAAESYKKIWETEGFNIIRMLEKNSGMRLLDTVITANVFDAPSYSGWKEEPMTLRSTYSDEVKKGTLIHELSHRLHAALSVYPETVKNDHEILFLYLYDVYTDLYGLDFANKMVAVESLRSNQKNDYKQLWADVLSLNRSERLQKLKKLTQQQ